LLELKKFLRNPGTGIHGNPSLLFHNPICSPSVGSDEPRKLFGKCPPGAYLFTAEKPLYFEMQNDIFISPA